MSCPDALLTEIVGLRIGAAKGEHESSALRQQ
jgi:hypothetical protein